MKAAIYGMRKIILFVLATGAVTVLAIVALDALKTISDAKATQAASIVVAAFGTLGTVFATLMSAFKRGYERDETIESAKASSPFEASSDSPAPGGQ
jgi:hypothetical protein